jgi:SAM-dependent methyltransferase
MRTDSKGYSDYLEAKYLPGRSFYLGYVFYPRIFRRFTTSDVIVDLGCGTGEFLNYCRRRKHEAIGIDSNEALARRCQQKGFKIVLDNICELNALKGQTFKYAICDNVLEHLDSSELDRFFTRLDTLLLPGGVLTCIVPGIRGFKCDPTHKSYICTDLLAGILKDRSVKITRFYYHPFNLRNVDKLFYLNMQVFEIEKSR